MEFKKASINGKSYGDLVDVNGISMDITDRTPRCDFSWNDFFDDNFEFYDQRVINEILKGNSHFDSFFKLLSLCHTVMPEETEEGWYCASFFYLFFLCNSEIKIFNHLTISFKFWSCWHFVVDVLLCFPCNKETILKGVFRQFSLGILLRRYFEASKPQTSKLRVRKCTTRFREKVVR